MKKTLLIVMLALLALSFAACGSTGGSGAVIGSVNGEDIYQSEYDYYLADYFDYYYSYYQNYYGMDLTDQATLDSFMPTFLSDLEQYSWERCVDSHLILQVAKEQFGITFEGTAAEAADGSDEATDENADENAAPTANSGDKDRTFVKDFLPYGEYCSIAASDVINQLSASEEVMTAAADASRAAYEADPKEYRGTSHILISCDDVNDEEKLAAAYEQAMSIISQLNGGADFDELASAYTADSSVSYDPLDADGNLIDGSSTFVKEYAEGAFALEAEGDITQEPVLSPYGYHIIRLDTVLSSFEQVEPYLNNVDNYINGLLDQYKAEADIVCNVAFKYYDPNAAAAGADVDEAADEAGANADADVEEEAAEEEEADENVDEAAEEEEADENVDEDVPAEEEEETAEETKSAE